MSARKAGKKIAPAAEVVVDGEVITTPVRPVLRELVITLPVAWRLDKVRESPFQHRTLYPGLDKLAASLTVDGFLEPMLARPIADHADEIELVSGHRRRRAGMAAGYLEGPFVIREMTDEQAIVAVGVHNLQREQPHPLEEALSYEMLAAPAITSGRQPRTVAEIARMFGQDARHVAQRLKLCALCDEGRELFFNDQLGVQTAFLIARMPHQDRQREVLAKMEAAANHWGGPMSVTQVRELIARSMRALSTVAFALADKTLPRWDGTGDCLSCTRQSGAQAVLFEDIEGKSMCLDAQCCTGKTEAHWVTVKTKAIEHGERVLTPEEVKATFPHGQLNYGAEFVDLDAHCHAAVDVNDEDIDGDEPGEPVKAPTYRELIGKQGAPVVMAYLPEAGRIVQLVARQDAVKALASAGHNEAAKEERREGTNGATMDPEKRKKDEAKERELAAIERQVGDAVLVAVLDNLAEKPAQAVMAHLASHVVSTSWSDTQRAVAGRRGLLDKKASNKRSAQELLIEHVATLRGPALLRLIVEMVYTKAGGVVPGYGQKEGALVGLAGLLGINVAKVRAEVKASSKAAAKAKKGTPTKKGGKASGKKAPAVKASAVDEGEEGDDEDEEASDFTVVGRIGAPSAPALEDLGPLADATPACRLCGCTEASPCADADGDACSWANVDMTLCTSCAYVLQAFEEQIDDRGAVGSRAGLIDLVQENSDFDASDKVMGKALEDVITSGRVVVVDGHLLSGTVVERIRTLCAMPKTTTQIAAAFKGIDRDVLGTMLEMLEAAGERGELAGLKGANGKWTAAARVDVAAPARSPEERIILATAEQQTAEEIAADTGLPLADVQDLVKQLHGTGKLTIFRTGHGATTKYMSHRWDREAITGAPTIKAPALPTTDKPAPTPQAHTDAPEGATRAERVLLARLQLTASSRVLVVGDDCARMAAIIADVWPTRTEPVYVAEGAYPDGRMKYPAGVEGGHEAQADWTPDRTLFLNTQSARGASRALRFKSLFGELPTGTGRIVAVMPMATMQSPEVIAILVANNTSGEQFKNDEDNGEELVLLAFYKNIPAPAPTASPAAKRAAGRRKAKATTQGVTS